MQRQLQCALTLVAAIFLGAPISASAASPPTLPATSGLERYHDDERQFSLELPAGWTVVSPEALRARPLTELEIPHELAFRPSEKSPGLSGYVLVENLPRDPELTSYADLEADLLKGREVADIDAGGPLERTILRLPYDQAGVDSNRQRVILRRILETPAERGAGNKVVVISALHIGKERTIGLHCCATPETFAKHLKLFVHLVDSFEFDPPHSFAAQSETAADQDAPSTLAAPAFAAPQLAIWVLLGMLTLLGCFIGGMIFVRPRKRRGPAEHQHGVNIRQGTSTSAAASLLQGPDAVSKHK